MAEHSESTKNRDAEIATSKLELPNVIKEIISIYRGALVSAEQFSRTQS